MTDETKRLIESVETTKSSVCFQKWNQCDVVRKSDFDRVVEKLTGWTKVKDLKPPIIELGFSEAVTLKDVNGKVYSGYYHCGINGNSWMTTDGKSMYFGYITEWKPII